MNCFQRAIVILFFLIMTVHPFCLFAQDQNTEVEASPKAPWGEFEIVEEEEPTTLGKILLWLPNRILDFIDIFRVDAGVGVSYGAVVRTSRYVQAGYRSMSPASFRIGLFGRQRPYMLEKSAEFGVSPFYSDSLQRKVCRGEFGAGVDLIFVGAYGGICVEEVVDFIGGIMTFDIMDDDLK